MVYNHLRKLSNVTMYLYHSEAYVILPIFWNVTRKGVRTAEVATGPGINLTCGTWVFRTAMHSWYILLVFLISFLFFTSVQVNQWHSTICTFILTSHCLLLSVSFPWVHYFVLWERKLWLGAGLSDGSFWPPGHVSHGRLSYQHRSVPEKRNAFYFMRNSLSSYHSCDKSCGDSCSYFI